MKPIPRHPLLRRHPVADLIAGFFAELAAADAIEAAQVAALEAIDARDAARVRQVDALNACVARSERAALDRKERVRRAELEDDPFEREYAASEWGGGARLSAECETNRHAGSAVSLTPLA